MLQPPPFGPLAGQGVFNIQLRSNVSSGETMTFKYYDGNNILEVNETYDYTQDDIVGNLITPTIFTAIASPRNRMRCRSKLLVNSTILL